MPILITGLCIIAIWVVINIWQMMPFFKALKELNRGCYGFWDRIVYPFKFIGILPKLIKPLLPDAIIVGCGGVIGFGGGLLGGIISMAATCMISLAFKFVMWLGRKDNEKERLEACL